MLINRQNIKISFIFCLGKKILLLYDKLHNRATFFLHLNQNKKKIKYFSSRALLLHNKFLMQFIAEIDTYRTCSLFVSVFLGIIIRISWFSGQQGTESHPLGDISYRSFILRQDFARDFSWRVNGQRRR